MPYYALINFIREYIKNTRCYMNIRLKAILNFRYLISILLVSVLSVSFNALQAQEDLQTLKVQHFLKLAKEQIQARNYVEANISFRRILDLKTKLTPEFCYLFSETLYMTHQHQNSHNFLDKYFEISSESDDYYIQAEDLMIFLEKEIAQIRSCQYCDLRGYVLIPCHKCKKTGKIVAQCYYCQGKKITFCMICHGNGVIISPDYFGGTRYHSCSECYGKAIIKCTVCKGEGQLELDCPICLGETTVGSSTVLCNHEQGKVQSKLDTEKAKQ